MTSEKKAKFIVNGLTTKERRDLDEPEEFGQLSPLYDAEELDECGTAIGAVPAIEKVLI